MKPCTECGGTRHMPRHVRAMTTGNRWYECRNCGTRYLEDHSRVGPQKFPIDSHWSRVSMWHPHYSRPPRKGLYECRFASIGDATVKLNWDGQNWTWEGKQVDVSDFRGWRGKLGPS